MRTIGIQTAADLASALSEFGNGYLFRGQTADYRNTKGHTTVSTSFSRHGCYPPRMLRWAYYARSILRTFVKGFDSAPDLATDQAILQHYGWRSFFVDATSNPAVAAWFAGHTYNQKPRIDITQDCWETGLCAVRERAWYTPADTTAVVYCISKKALRAEKLEAVDLQEIASLDGRPRYVAQSAWMVGPLGDSLPTTCIAAKILGPSSVFREFSTENALRKDRDLFPGPDEDKILDALLSIPWQHINDGAPVTSMQFYSRGLPLPEYNWTYTKIHHPRAAFYRPFWVATETSSTCSILDHATFMLAPEHMFYGGTTSNDVPAFPTLTHWLRDHHVLVLETDGLIRHPASSDSQLYGKGVYIQLVDNDLLQLGEMDVSHPGMRPADVGVVRGLHYRIDARGKWARSPHRDDCPCGNADHHEHHLDVARRWEIALAEGQFTVVNPNVFAHKECDSSLSLDHLKSPKERGQPYFPPC